MKDISPCFQCPKRYPGCSANCDDTAYIAWRERQAAKKKAIREQKTYDAKLTHYAVDVARKKKKRNGRRK